MTNKEITNIIKILAEFMNINIAKVGNKHSFIFYICDEDGYVDYTSFDCKIYDPFSDWNQLVDILRKIETISIIPEELYQDKLESHNSEIWYYFVDLNQMECLMACVEFIKEYNKIKK